LLVGGRGLALVIAHGQLVQLYNPTFLSLGAGDLLGIPISVLVAAVLAVVAGLLVQRTTFGRRIGGIGGNRAASRLAGLPVRRVLVGVYRDLRRARRGRGCAGDRAAERERPRQRRTADGSCPRSPPSWWAARR